MLFRLNCMEFGLIGLSEISMVYAESACSIGILIRIFMFVGWRGMGGV